MMDSLNHTRELLLDEEQFNNTLAGLCQPFCDPTVNQSGFCISPCFNICPNVCQFPRSPLVPPPDPPEDFPQKSHHLSSLWIILLAVFATSVVVVSCAIYMRYYSDWCRPRRRRLLSEQPQTIDNHEDFLDGPELDHPIWYIRTIGLEPSIIGAITVCKYKRGDGLVEGTECSVCLNEFHDDEVLRLLPKCNHAFHIPCIDTWLRAHTNCPMCRAPIVTNIGQTAIEGRAPIVTNIVQTAIEGSGSREDINVTTANDIGSSSGLEIVTDQALEGKEDEGETSIEGSSQRLELENPNGMQLMRRSVSMHALSAMQISVENANVVLGDSTDRNNSAPETAEDNQNQQLNGNVSKRVNEEKVILQSGSDLKKRSLSWSGRLLLSRYGSILPL